MGAYACRRPSCVGMSRYLSERLVAILGLGEEPEIRRATICGHVDCYTLFVVHQVAHRPIHAGVAVFLSLLVAGLCERATMQ